MERVAGGTTPADHHAVLRSPPVDSAERRAETAVRKVTLERWHREVKRQHMQWRPPQVATRPISQEVREFHPEAPVRIDRKVFLVCLRSAPRGSSPGPGGCTYAHLKMLLDEMDTVELLLEAITSLARADVPSDVTDALISTILTALAKLDRAKLGFKLSFHLMRFFFFPFSFLFICFCFSFPHPFFFAFSFHLSFHFSFVGYGPSFSLEDEIGDDMNGDGAKTQKRLAIVLFCEGSVCGSFGAVTSHALLFDISQEKNN